MLTYAGEIQAWVGYKTTSAGQHAFKVDTYYHTDWQQSESFDLETKGLSTDAIYEYLGRTTYAEAVPEIRKSPSAFERWCDNLMIRKIRPEIHHPFTIGPLAAYILARDNEIKCVRMILSGKVNDLSTESIRERVRETYV